MHSKKKVLFHHLEAIEAIYQLVAPAWSAEEDRNNGHMDEVLIVTAIRISWIQEVTQVQINKELLTIHMYYIEVVGLQNSAPLLFHPHRYVLDTWSRITCTQQQST